MLRKPCQMAWRHIINLILRKKIAMPTVNIQIRFMLLTQKGTYIKYDKFKTASAKLRTGDLKVLEYQRQVSADWK